MSLVRSALVKTCSTIWITLAGFVTSVVLNRALGPTEYGALVLAYAAAMFAWHFVDLGANATLSRFLPQHRSLRLDERAAALVRVGWQCLSVGILLGVVGLWGGAEWIATTVLRQPSVGPLIRVSVGYFVTLSVLQYCLQFLQAVQSWRTESLLSAVYPTLYLLGCGAGWLMGRLTASWVLMWNAVAAGITLGILWLAVRHEHRRLLVGGETPSVEATQQARGEVFSFGAPLLINNMLFFILMWADKLILGRSRSLEELTFYYVGFAFFNALVILTKTFHAVLLPYISQVATEGQERIQAAFRITIFWFFQWSIAVSLVTFVFIEPVVRICYGPTYATAAQACRWLLAVFILRTFINALGLFLHNAFGMGKTSAALSVVLVATQVAASLWLVPIFGWQGAVWASIAAYVVFGTAMAVGVAPIRRLWSWSLVLGTLGMALGAVAVAALSVWALPAWRYVTVPLWALAIGWIATVPILRDRYHWQPALSPLEVWRRVRGVSVDA